MTTNTLAPSPPRSLPVLTFLAHVDATSNLEPCLVAEVDRLEQAYRPDTRVRVELSRKSRPPAVTIGLGAAEIVAAAVVAKVAAPAAGPLAPLVMWGGSLVLADGVSHLVAANRDIKMHHEPAWNGTRIYDIGPDVEKGRIDSPLVGQSDVLKPSVPELARFIADGMKKYPAQVTAVMASGHGMAYTEECSGYTVKDLKKALDDAASRSGKKVDVVVLEACLMGNLESLRILEDSARYAVVSEETMGGMGLPWQNILGSLPKGSMTAEQFGKKIVDGSIATPGIDTVAVIDLQKVEPLSKAVENLAIELRRVVAQGGRSQVRAALKQAAAYPRDFLGAVGRFAFDVRDLGELTDSVAANVTDPKAQQAAANVKSALRDTVVCATTSDEYQDAGHITIQGLRPFFNTGKYVQETGLSEWGALLADMKLI